jgi:hypothetical protein
MSIIDGRPDQQKAIAVSLPCGSNATLTFEYKAEQDGHMGAYLIINKDKQTITFRFETHQLQMYSHSEDRVITTVIQLGLKIFAKELDWYIKSIDADNQANELPEGFKQHQSYPPQASTEMWNNVNL